MQSLGMLDALRLQMHVFQFLRVKSPSADNAIIGADGRARVTSGRRHVGIMGLEPVGSYALR